MFENIENLKIEGITKGTSKRTSSVNCRNINAFILRTAGNVRYTFSDHSIDAPTGTVIFLPKGSSYDFTTISDESSEYISLRFEADLTLSKPSCYPFEDFKDAEEFINNITDLWKFGNKSDHYKCYAIFYNLLSYIDNLENMTYENKKKSKLISPAISYLKKHIYDCDLNVEILHNLCGISGTYFRKIFYANYSMSPQKYIINKRLSHAKTIIDTGDYDTISEVSLSVGFNDPLYFSRVFKKMYGTSPSQYLKD